jgi:hypothetical protein
MAQVLFLSDGSWYSAQEMLGRTLLVDTTCPICRGPATHELPFGDTRRMTCDTCGRYDITGSAIAVAENASDDKRRTALALAKRNAVPPKVPLITSNSF